MNTLFQIRTSSYDGKLVPPELDNRNWDLVVTGNSDIDIRSKAAYEFALKHASSNFKFRYCVQQKRMLVNDSQISGGGLKAKLNGVKKLLIETTSLDCPDILYLLRSAKDQGVAEISFLYLEPLEYKRPIKGGLSDHRNFNLSENRRFQSIHGFMANLNDIPKGQAVFFLGFEKARLGQALEQEEALQSWHRHAVFGVPAFEPGWEIDSLSNNVNQLASLKYDLQYVAASSVEAAYILLNQLLQDDKTDSPIVVAPLGTKPHTIATSLFLVEHNAYDRAILLYDHPQRSTDRSDDIGRWHMYDINI